MSFQECTSYKLAGTTFSSLNQITARNYLLYWVTTFLYQKNSEVVQDKTNREPRPRKLQKLENTYVFRVFNGMTNKTKKSLGTKN